MNKLWEFAQFRCFDCNKLLMEESITAGAVRLWCNNCKKIVEFHTGKEVDKETSKTAELVENKWYLNN